MKRDLLFSVLAVWGVALLCLSVLDWADYQSFLHSLLAR
jgi:hypothetical protein